MTYVFNESKYTKYYFNIISNAQTLHRNKKESYFESHHIIPKSLGGNNSKSNRVLLTAREHYVCHLLLVRIVNTTDTYRMVNAIRRFQTDTRSSKEFENIRRTVSVFSRGEYNPSFGKIWIHNKNTEEILYLKAEEFDALDKSIFTKGLPHQRGGHRNTFWINNGHEETLITIGTEIPDGWLKGKLSVPTLSHMKKMSAIRHSGEKDAEHSKKLSGRKYIINPLTKEKKRVKEENLNEYISVGYILDISTQAKKCSIDNVIYDSLSHAAKIFNISAETIRYRIKSNNETWSSWNYLP